MGPCGRLHGSGEGPAQRDSGFTGFLAYDEVQPSGAGESGIGLLSPDGGKGVDLDRGFGAVGSPGPKTGTLDFPERRGLPLSEPNPQDLAGIRSFHRIDDPKYRLVRLPVW